MVTVTDPVANASDAHEALRRLTHGTRNLEHSEDAYDILASAAAGLHALQQSLRQLATWHERNAARAATDDGDRDAGQRHAHVAATHLHDAADLAGLAANEVDHAHNSNGRIAWQPAPPPERRDRLPPAHGHDHQPDMAPRATHISQPPSLT